MTPALPLPGWFLRLSWQGRISVALGLASIAVAVWTAIASYVLLRVCGLLDHFEMPDALWQWWVYRPYFHANDRVHAGLQLGAIAGAAPFVLIAIAVQRQRIGPSMRPRLFGGQPAPIRGRTDNLGRADWMPIAKARQLFSGPNTSFGGVVVGEAYRVDQDKVAGVAFDPANRATWGQGGKEPLLIDPCATGPTHSLVFAGAGSFKSMCAVSTLLTWTGSVVVLDPAGELGDMLADARKRMDHAVYRLDLRSTVGFNVLDWIDITAPTAITNLLSVVSWVCGDPAINSRDKPGEFFESRGRALVACLLAHMLWDPDLDPALKTLVTLRGGVAVPQPVMRQVLADIHVSSKCPLARDYAGTLKDLVEETFSGIYANADESTAWLANPAFASIVSGDTFKTEELRSGRVSVFLQMSLAALQTTPALGRCVIGRAAELRLRGGGRGERAHPLSARRGGPARPAEDHRGRARRRPEIRHHPAAPLSIGRPAGKAVGPRGQAGVV